MNDFFLYFEIKANKLFLWIKYFFIQVFSRDFIIVFGGFNFNKKGKLGTYNFGDDLNIPLVEAISKKKVIPLKYALEPKKHTVYSCIGSIIGLGDENTAIWGSGLISNYLPDNFRSSKIYAVRGPMTRNQLLQRGINCPEIFGDPALLLPLFYNPKQFQKKYEIGIIPHYIDKNCAVLEKYKSNHSIKILDIQHQGKWTEFIDQILQCEIIVSSSLHGIIIADTYLIPNLWVEFSNNVVGNGFKFKDYFLSVNKKIVEPLKINDYIDPELLKKQINNWEMPIINTDKLLSSCAFFQKK